MKVDRIPLAVRLERLNKGCASDPKYDICTIKRWAKIPICDYMAAFPEENGKLLQLLYLSEEEAAGMTYRDIAVKVDELFLTPGPARRHNAIEAMELLALPFERYYSEYIERIP